MLTFVHYISQVLSLVCDIDLCSCNDPNEVALSLSLIPLTSDYYHCNKTSVNIMIVTMLFTNFVIVLATSTTPTTTSTTAESTASPSPLGRKTRHFSFLNQLSTGKLQDDVVLKRPGIEKCVRHEVDPFYQSQPDQAPFPSSVTSSILKLRAVFETGLFTLVPFFCTYRLVVRRNQGELGEAEENKRELGGRD